MFLKENSSKTKHIHFSSFIWTILVHKYDNHSSRSNKVDQYHVPANIHPKN